MHRLLANHALVRDYGDRLAALCATHGLDLLPLGLPEDPAALLDEHSLTTIEVACCTDDFVENSAATRRFLGCALRAPNLRWMHLPNAGVDHPVFGWFLERGVRLTTSSGANAEPIAHTAIAALLMLARGFPDWLAAQRRHQWAPHPPACPPRDLRGQTMVIVGLGGIGKHIARIARTLGLRVVGVRRQPRSANDNVDEIHPPGALPELLPGADWLVLACPLTDTTRGLVDSAVLGCLPVHACVLNVARGAVIDEPALIAALRASRLGGAYLDVFQTEPLPADSPLWDMPNVIITPHDSSVCSGNRARVSELFLENLSRWARNEPLINEVSEQ